MGTCIRLISTNRGLCRLGEMFGNLIIHLMLLVFQVFNWDLEEITKNNVYVCWCWSQISEGKFILA